MRLEIDNADLQQVVKQVVERVIFRLDELQLSDSKRLAYTEPEAAAALGIKRHVLRDARLRGEIQASRTGRRILYAKSSLIEFLDQTRS